MNLTILFKKRVNKVEAPVWRNKLCCFKISLCCESVQKGVVLSSLRDGGELSLMNGDNNLGGINWPRLWLLFLRNVNTYRVT